MRGKVWMRNKWAWSIAMAAGVSAAIPAGGLFAQQPATPAQPPVLPGQTVTGTPPASAPDTNFPPPEAPPPSNTPSIAAGGVFASPIADGYGARSSTTATKIDAPNLDIPAIVDVIPAAVIRDQQALDLSDIVRNIPGASQVTNNTLQRPDTFSIRGFTLGLFDIHKNGFRDPSFAPRDMANVERIEVLEGPASVLYGSSQPSGLVNYITKKPLDYIYNSSDVTVGSFGLFRVTSDNTGPLDDAGHFLYRINVAYQHNDSFRDFGFTEKFFFSPSLTWVIDEDTSFNVEYELLNQRNRFDTGVVALGGVVGSVPISNYYGEPGDIQRYHNQNLTALLNRRINDDWSVRIGGFMTWYDFPSFYHQPIATLGQVGGTPTGPLGYLTGPPFNLNPNTTLIRNVQDFTGTQSQYYSITADVNGKFEIFGMKNNLVAGTELGWDRRPNIVANSTDPFAFVPVPAFGGFVLPVPSAPINAINPVYGQTLPVPENNFFKFDQHQNLYGFYVQDLIDLTDNLKLMAGVRGDIDQFHFTDSANVTFAGVPVSPSLPYGPISTDATYYHMSPRVGLVYQPIKDVLSFYGSYSQSFDPPSGFPSDTPVAILPEIGRSVEGGMKADLLDKRLTVTATGYYIVKNNVVEPSALDPFFEVQIGEVRSQGFEASAQGKLTDEWSIIANYSYIDARVRQDVNPAIVGTRVLGVPFNTFNIWTRYNLIQEEKQTLGVAAGFVYQGNRGGDLGDSFQLPGYGRWDAGVYYQRGFLRGSLYFENIFDRQYYVSSLNALQIYPGTPFNVRGQIGITY